MGGLKTYEVEVGGFKTSVRLSDVDAKARGLLKAPAKPATKPPADKPAAKEAAAPANKSRAAATDK